jgi:hypothetical protein
MIEVRTKNLPNKGLQCYSYTNLLTCKIFVYALLCGDDKFSKSEDKRGNFLVVSIRLGTDCTLNITAVASHQEYKKSY